MAITLKDFNDTLVNATHFANNVVNTGETACNIGACIPVVGLGFIAAHASLGLFQVIKGLGCAIIGGLGETLAKAAGSDKEFTRTFRIIKDFGSEHFKHGLLNLLQSTQQLVVGLGFFNLTNLALPAFRDWDFAPAYKYTGAGG